MTLNIDDPIKAAKELIASDERQRSVVTEKMANALADAGLPGAAFIARFLDNRRAENRDLLLNVLADEVRKVIERLGKLSNEHERFIGTDFAELVMDGLRKAENLRSKERVIRLGQILASAAEIGPTVSSDDTEDMLRVATVLDDIDVQVLREFVETQGDILRVNNGRAVFNEVNPRWKERRPCPKMHESDLTSICAKLESLGLVIRMEKNNSFIGPDVMSPYGLLPKGERFVRFVERNVGDLNKRK